MLQNGQEKRFTNCVQRRIVQQVKTLTWVAVLPTIKNNIIHHYIINEQHLIKTANATMPIKTRANSTKAEMSTKSYLGFESILIWM